MNHIKRNSFLLFLSSHTTEWQLFTKLIDTFFFFSFLFSQYKEKREEKSLKRKFDLFDWIRTLLSNNSLIYTYIHVYVYDGSREK